MASGRRLTGVAAGADSQDSSLAARELGFLVRLAQAAASTQKPDELLALIIHEATSAMGTDVCSLYLVVPPGREMVLTATNGLNENMVGKVRMRVGEGITGWVAETREPAVAPDVSRDPHWKWVPGLDEDRFHAMLSVPIESGPRLIGVLNAQAAERRDFNAGDIARPKPKVGNVVQVFARQQGLGIGALLLPAGVRAYALLPGLPVSYVFAEPPARFDGFVVGALLAAASLSAPWWPAVMARAPDSL